MPLLPGKSKKAFSKNVEIEMNAGKPQKQALAIAYSVKRKKKASGGSVASGSKDMNYADGGRVNESAKSEHRPMPDERDKDSKMVGQNSGNKASKDDSWSSNVTIKQAQKPSITKLSQPKMVGSDVFSVRNRDMHEDEADMMDRLPPESDQAQPVKRDDEHDAKKMGKNPDMAAQHDNGKPPYNKAIEDQYAQDMAAAEMKKTQSYAQGGPVMEPEDSHEELKERDDEAHLQSMEAPSEDEGYKDAMSLDEEDEMGHNSGRIDMEDEHSNHRKPYARGGEVSPEDEIEEERHNSIAAAIMSRRDRMHDEVDSGAYDLDHAVKMAEGGEISNSDKIINRNIKRSNNPELAKKNIKDFQEAATKKPKKYAEGGEIHSHDSIYSDDSSQADLSRNADEDANEEDQLSFNALRKENYNESEGLAKLDNPRDSGQKGDDREDESENKMDRVSAIRSRMNAKRQFPR